MKQTKLWMIAVIITFCCGTTVFTSCNKNDNPVVPTPTPTPTPFQTLFFPNWNTCEALDVLQEYVEDVTNPRSANFITAEDRIATFDMDGTFVGELYPTYFEYNLLEYRALDDPDYKDKAPDDVREAAQDIRNFVRHGKKLPDHFDMKHAHAAAKAYAGMTIAEFDAYVKAYAATPANGFTGMTYGESFYKPMLDRVIGMDVMLKSNNQGDNEGVNYTMGKDEYLIRTDSLLIKDLKTNKVKQIAQEIGKIPVMSFGNSSGDQAMHNYCLSNGKYRTATFMLVADDDVRDHADLEEGAKREAKWRENGYTVISMKNDFKTIYGPDVLKTDFTFPEEN